MIEIWKAITGWPYEISSGGRVRSIDRVMTRRDGVVIRFRGRILRMRMSNGYSSVVLQHEGRKKPMSVHSLVAEAFIGPRPAGLQVCHFDGNRRNNAVGNLRYDTVTANHADRRRHGTLPIGERVGSAKLSPSLVSEIRSSSEKQRDIARRIGVSKSTIGAVRRREVWGWL